MASLETGYQPLFTYSDGEDNPEHTVHYTESRKGQWQMKDLDSFFKRVYEYHQGGGLKCLILRKVSDLVVFLFMCVFTIFLTHGINYPVLFKDTRPSKSTSNEKVTLVDAIYSFDEFARGIGLFTILFICAAALACVILIYRLFCNISQNIEIREFYTKALNIAPSEIENLTWYDVQKTLLEVQKEEHVCVHKRDLTELDIYHRILRYKNYMVAMVNKDVIPLKIRVPVIGETAYLSKALLYNLDLVLFRSPWAPFQKWQLRPEYKSFANREKLARELSQQFATVALINFILSPFVFVWQILFHFFTYTASIKVEPSVFSVRRWSQYARLYLRHFNELDHELNARLCRGYKPGKQYVEMFTSRILVVSLHPIKFISGAMLSVIFCLSLYDNDVIQVDQVLTLGAVLGIILAGILAVSPDPNLVWRPAQTMKAIVAHIHYVPEHWHGKEHTPRVRNEFTMLFPYSATYIIEEILSPLLTPLILYFRIRHSSQDIVDFFRNFTVEVTGVGDVCSFAQMDIRHHGNPKWLSEGCTEADRAHQAEFGKTELSLIHFTCTNPTWTPPDDASNYLRKVREQVQKDGDALRTLGQANALAYSLQSVSSLGPRFADLVGSCSSRFPMPSTRPSHTNQRIVVRNVSHKDGPIYISAEGGIGILSELESMHGSLNNVNVGNLEFNTTDENFLEWSAARMSLSALYMHERVQCQQALREGLTESNRAACDRSNDNVAVPMDGTNPRAENLPLLPLNR